MSRPAVEGPGQPDQIQPDGGGRQFLRVAEQFAGQPAGMVHFTGGRVGQGPPGGETSAGLLRISGQPRDLAVEDGDRVRGTSEVGGTIR